MLGIFVDLQNELDDIEREVGLLPASIRIVETSAAMDDIAHNWLVVQGLASGLEKIYSGCERVMAKIASEFDNSRIEKYDGWHISLLKRLAHPFPGRRDAIISEVTYIWSEQNAFLSPSGAQCLWT